MENPFFSLKLRWIPQGMSSHHQLYLSLTSTSSTSTTPTTLWTSGPPTGPKRVMRPPRWTTSSATTTTARWWTARCSSPRESRNYTFVSDKCKNHHEAPLFLLRHNYDNLQDVVLGTDKVIDGLDLALRGMCVGEKRLITVPPHLGHGENGGKPTARHHNSEMIQHLHQC